MALITLKEWNKLQPRQRCMEQVRRWVREGRIQPPPILDGREYLVEETAVKINLKSKNSCPVYDRKNISLRERIKNGRAEKKP